MTINFLLGIIIREYILIEPIVSQTTQILYTPLNPYSGKELSLLYLNKKELKKFHI